MTIDQPNFWEGFKAFQGYANMLADAGIYASYIVSAEKGLIVQPFVAPNASAEQFVQVSICSNLAIRCGVFQIILCHT